MTYMDMIEKRRSIYDLKTSASMSDLAIEALMAEALKHTPSAFNSQTSRLVLLLDEGHEALWEITRMALKALVDPKSFEETSQKIDGFKKAHGTILFFEDQKIVQGLQDQFPAYSDNFPVWSNQTSGMVQSNIWVALALEGLGASLQHYSGLIEDKVKAKWSIDPSWKLLAQMPFGDINSQAGDKTFMPLDQRLKVFKA